MKAAVLISPGILELVDLPDPECPKGGALIKVKACAVCGTDVKMLEVGHRDLAYPRILGHEIAEKDLVQVWPGIVCGQCRPCRDHRLRKPIKKLRAWIVEQNSQPKERLEKFDDMLDLACT